MRPIDADGLKELFNSRSSHPIYDEWSTLGILGVIDEMPTIDVVVVKHGEWVPSEYQPHHTCSVCGHWFSLYDKVNYCPNCGAKMDLEEE